MYYYGIYFYVYYAFQAYMPRIETGPQTESRTELPPHLKRQLDVALSLRDRFMEERGRPSDVIKRERTYLRNFTTTALEERAERARDVISPEVQTASNIADNFFTSEPYRLGCIDGRNKFIYAFGVPPDIGGDYRLPAGDPLEIKRGPYGRMVIPKDSHYSEALSAVIKKSNGKRPAILLDSHIGCAARKIMSDGTKQREDRKTYDDSGLLDDVKRKKEIAGAIHDFSQQETIGSDPLETVQYSYHPRTNYIYMGLERDENIEEADAMGGYTAEVLETMQQEGKILYTGDIAEHETVRTALERKLFRPDFKSNYRDSMRKFWSNIEALAEDTELMDAFESELTKVFPELDSSDDEHEYSKQVKLQLLLLNTYMGYLNNVAGTVAKDHTENTVVVTDREYGPFNHVSGFQVSRNSGDIPADVDLGIGIILNNRESDGHSEAIRDVTGTYEDGEYINAPVSVLVQVVDREGLPDWDEMAETDFSDLGEFDWRKMPQNEFNQYIIEKRPGISAKALEDINRLREKARKLLEPYEPTSDKIINGDVHVTYVITDRNRNAKLILPLEYRGYE